MLSVIIPTEGVEQPAVATLSALVPGAAAGWEEFRRGGRAQPGALAAALGDAREPLEPQLARLARI